MNPIAVLNRAPRQSERYGSFANKTLRQDLEAVRYLTCEATIPSNNHAQVDVRGNCYSFTNEFVSGLTRCLAMPTAQTPINQGYRDTWRDLRRREKAVCMLPRRSRLA